MPAPAIKTGSSRILRLEVKEIPNSKNNSKVEKYNNFFPNYKNMRIDFGLSYEYVIDFNG